jgi:spore coat polysaccharide biosynthesis predicted glycosyltransferase SpsG
VEKLYLNKFEIIWYIKLDKKEDNIPFLIGNVIIQDWDNDFFSDLYEFNDFCLFDSYNVNLDNFIDYSNNENNNVFIVSITDSNLIYYSKGVILFPSLYANNLIIKINSNEILYGPENFLAQNIIGEYLINEDRIEQKNKNLRIGVSLGGAVDSSLVFKIIRIIREKDEAIEINLYSSITNCPYKINSIGFLPKKEYIKSIIDVDLLITASGQSLNEAVILGVPVIPIAINESQIKNRDYWLNKLNLSVKCSYFNFDFDKKLKLSLKKNLNTILPLEERVFLANGSSRVANKLMKLYNNYIA